MSEIEELTNMERVRPFSNGSEFTRWEQRNCNRCIKSYTTNAHVGDNGEGPCDIDNALTVAYITDGHVLKSIRDRMGLPDTHNCLERELL